MEIRQTWSRAESVAFYFSFCFIVLFTLTFSFPHPLVPPFTKLFSPLFERLAMFTASLFGMDKDREIFSLVSDSAGLYLHTFNLLILSSCFAFLWYLREKGKSQDRLFFWLTVFVRYYLALHLFTYGFNKVFKWQFYLPEPNTLYTPLGRIPKDLLYWSTLGASRGYTIFLGATEVIAACFLLFRRSYVFGAMLALFIFLNVLAVNLFFNISVKLFTFYLIFLTMFLLMPRIRSLCNYFFRSKIASLHNSYELKGSRGVYVAIKTLGVLFLLSSSLWDYIRTGNYNDDAQRRPPFHGAYSASVFVLNNDTLTPSLTDTIRWKRAFIHRKGYFIIQRMNDQLEDFELTYDFAAQTFDLLNYVDSSASSLSYTVLRDSSMKLSGNFFGKNVRVYLKKENKDALWLLKKEFDWSIKR